MSDRVRPVLRRFISIYALSLGGMALLVLLMLVFSGRVPVEEIRTVFAESLKIISSNFLTYILAFLPYLGYLLILSLKNDYRKGGKKKLLKGISLKIILPASTIFLLLNLLSL
ncbi:MAG: hypothetical protein AAFR87_32770, partial [Bacteroidota bacterium]